MSSIVNWEYYDSLHNNCESDEFPKLEALAEQKVREVIGKPNWDAITPQTYGYDVLKDCICNVIDKMISDANSGRGKGLSSVSNDGYSETYAIKDEADLRNEMASNIRAWLSGTGLVRAY
jgi:hypothetical protein